MHFGDELQCTSLSPTLHRLCPPLLQCLRPQRLGRLRQVSTSQHSKTSYAQQVKVDDSASLCGLVSTEEGLKTSTTDSGIDFRQPPLRLRGISPKSEMACWGACQSTVKHQTPNRRSLQSTWSTDCHVAQIGQVSSMLSGSGAGKNFQTTSCPRNHVSKDDESGIPSSHREPGRRAPAGRVKARPDEAVRVHFDSELIATKWRYVSSVPTPIEEIRCRYAVLSNLWLLDQMRQPGRSMHSDLDDSTERNSRWSREQTEFGSLCFNGHVAFATSWKALRMRPSSHALNVKAARQRCGPSSMTMSFVQGAASPHPGPAIATRSQHIATRSRRHAARMTCPALFALLLVVVVKVSANHHLRVRPCSHWLSGDQGWAPKATTKTRNETEKETKGGPFVRANGKILMPFCPISARTGVTSKRRMARTWPSNASMSYTERDYYDWQPNHFLNFTAPKLALGNLESCPSLEDVAIRMSQDIVIDLGKIAGCSKAFTTTARTVPSATGLSISHFALHGTGKWG